jgi:putative hydrolase of the HAD superfamily
MYAIFGPPPEAAPERADAFRKELVVEEQEAARLERAEIERLAADFFPELGGGPRALRLVTGVIFDFDETLAILSRSHAELLEEGARNAAAYMRSTGMDLADEFWEHMIDARRFAEQKSEEEQEEHIADDALSFLLQFVGYPISRMDPQVLQRAVDIFYAPEMTAWRLRPGALDLVRDLHSAGYRLALLANYNCDRAFQRTVDFLGIRPFLDLCLASASVEYRKPDARFFQIALDRWQAQPYEVVVVGDSLRHDVAGGLELGALTIQVTRPGDPEDPDLAAVVTPDAAVDDLAAVAARIEEWAAP